MATSSGFGRGGGGLIVRTVSRGGRWRAREADENPLSECRGRGPGIRPGPDVAAAVKAEEAAQPQPRTNFAETAFFQRTC